MAPQLLTGTKSRNIKKLQIKGRLQLRPLLCRGPINMEQEYTFLLGAIERNYKYEPRDAIKKAETNRTNLLTDNSRRILHEPLGRAT